MNGVAVHAVRGKRKEYKPLKSVLCDSSSPLDVASAFKVLGFSELYVADLDAIVSRGSNTSTLKRMARKTGLQLMVDAGVASMEKAEELLQNGVSRVVLGTETLTDLGFVKEAIERLGPGRVTASLDLVNGRVLSASEEAKQMDAVALARVLQGMGVVEIIVLDLARVGSGEGVDLALLKRIQENLRIRVLVGGGIRDVKDLAMLKKLGVDGVLLATALHSGSITVEELRHLG